MLSARAWALALVIGSWVQACTGEKVTEVQVTSITVSPEQVEVTEGDEVHLSATVQDESGAPLPAADPEWSSDAPAVATVDASGNVRALSPGTARVRATFAEAFGVATVMVRPGPGITLSDATVAIYAPAGGDPAPVTVEVGNAGEGVLTGLDLAVSYDGGDEWLSATLEGSSTPTRLTLDADADDLAAGVYHAAVTISPETEGVEPRELEVTLTATGFTVQESAGDTEVSEGGGTDTLAVRLDVQPAANVVLAVVASDGGEATAAPSQLTFTSATWSTPQSIVVSGVDDAEADGAQGSTVTVSVNTGGTDAAFHGIAPREVSVRTEDDDIPGFDIVETGGSTAVAETGSTDSFTLRLSARPLTDVVVALGSGDPGEVAVAPPSLRFTPANWLTPQTIQVVGADDLAVDGDQVTSVTLSVQASASDDAFDQAEDDVRVTTTDDDLAGVSLVQSGGSSAVTEAGGSDAITIALSAQPTGNVALSVASGDESEVTVSPARVSFTSSDWRTPKTVNLVGVDDGSIDGSQVTTVTVSVDDASSHDAWDGVADLTFSVTNADNDAAGVGVTQSGGTTTVDEAGSTDDLAVVLTAQPTTDVVLRVAAADAGEVTVSPATLTFPPGAWNTAQTVTVRGVDDMAPDGAQVTAVTLSVDAAASDDAWDAVPTSSVNVTTSDDDSAGFTVTETDGATVVEEGGAVDQIQVVLTATPLSTVIIDVASANVLEVSTSPSTLTFGPANWNTAQTVTIQAIDDILPDGDRTVNVTVSVMDLFSDDAFDAAPNQTVSVSSSDNDVLVGLRVTESEGSTVVYESGTTDTISVALDSQPSANVVLTVTGDTPSEATVAPGIITFAPSGWNTPQMVTVAGVDDAAADGDQVSTVTIAVDDAASDDAYDAVADATVSVTTRPGSPTGVSGPNPTGNPDVSSAQLVASYDMSTLTGSGLLRDFSGRGLHGDISGTTEIMSPRGRARRFAVAPADRIELPARPDFDLDGPLTVAVWFRLDDAGQHQHVVACDDKFVLWVTPNDRVRFTNAQGDGAETTSAIVADRWYGVVGVLRGTAGDVIDSSNLELWIDGQQVSVSMDTASGQSPPRWRDGVLWPTDACYIGFESHQGLPDHQTMAFHGSIDEVLVFGRAVTPTEAGLLSTR